MTINTKLTVRFSNEYGHCISIYRYFSVSGRLFGANGKMRACSLSLVRFGFRVKDKVRVSIRVSDGVRVNTFYFFFKQKTAYEI